MQRQTHVTLPAYLWLCVAVVFCTLATITNTLHLSSMSSGVNELAQKYETTLLKVVELEREVKFLEERVSKSERRLVELDASVRDILIRPPLAAEGDDKVGATAEPRSPKWAAVRNKFLVEHPQCAFAGCTKSHTKGDKMNVHHILPFHLFPEEELNPDNLITLCRDPHGGHHLWVGHLGNYTDYNKQVRGDCEHGVFREQAKTVWEHNMKHKGESLSKTLLAP